VLVIHKQTSVASNSPSERVKLSPVSRLTFGLDFGTTNSSLSILRDGQPLLLPIDTAAINKEVVRSALYFYPKKFTISNKVTPEQLESQTYNAWQVSYEGENKNLIGEGAVRAYLNDNKQRKKGVKRKILTGEIIRNVILYVTPSGTQVLGDIPDYYEEYDYGTGRLFHALKTALKSPYYKGSRVFGNYYTLEQLISLFIKELRQNASRQIGEDVVSVTCGRPVYFSPDPQKDRAAQDRLEAALKESGFKNISFEFEPIAAAKYYLSRFPKKGQRVLVFDFGGGTLDTTIIENKEGFKVLATDGVYIGGDLLNSDIFYNRLGPIFGTQNTWGEKSLNMPYNIISALQSWYGIPNLNTPETINFLESSARHKSSNVSAIDRLLHLIHSNLGFEIYESIEIAKKELTLKKEAVISFSDGPINISEKITRQDFEEIIAPRVESIRNCVMRTLRKACVDPEEISVVVRTGGSSLIPVFEQMLHGIFGQNKVTEFDPFTSIAAGLSISSG